MFRAEGAPSGAGETGAEDLTDVSKRVGEAASSSFTDEEMAALKSQLEQDDAEVKKEQASLDELKAEYDAIFGSSGEGTGEGTVSPEEARKTAEKAKGNSALKVAIGTAVVVVGVAVAAAIGYFKGGGGAVQEDPNQIAADVNQENNAEAEANPLAGELENGTKYDYTHYADRHIEYDEDGMPQLVTEKEAWNAYDYDYSDDFDNREATVEHINAVAGRTPEALASYAYNLFFDDEKEELGITGMSMTEIDDLMSNEENGGEMQAKLLAKLDEVLRDEHTSLRFYHENGTEETNYIYFIDENGDGIMDPTEVHLGYDTRERNGAPQVDIYRHTLVSSDKDGDYYESKKMLDLNMECGYQPNYEKGEVPDGLPYIPADETNPVIPVSAGNESAGEESVGDEGTGSEETGQEGTGEEPTGDEGTGNENTGWGKEGDPHGGDNVDVSEPVNPNSEVTQQESETVNDGNQGYIDDGGAAPGQGSDANSPANNPDRLEGGQNQGGDTLNGVNPNQGANGQGQQVDTTGNTNQEAAQQTIAVGGNNNSDAAEVQAVENGDF